MNKIMCQVNYSHLTLNLDLDFIEINILTKFHELWINTRLDQ